MKIVKTNMIEFIKTKLPVTYANIYDDLWFISFQWALVGILNVFFTLFLYNLNIEYTNYYIYCSFSLIVIIFSLKYFFYKNIADGFCNKLFNNNSINSDKIEIQMITKIETSYGRKGNVTGNKTKSFFIAVTHDNITFEISCNKRFDRIEIQKELLTYFINSVCLPAKKVIIY
jgi:hypothetical protein